MNQWLYWKGKWLIDMLKLREWNEVLDYADDVYRELVANGYNVKVKQYSIYDGRKGIYLIVYDGQNVEYQRYASGIHDTAEMFKRYIDMNKRRIIKELSLIHI